MVTCPFCAIVTGKQTAEVILETEEFLCFPPLFQEVPGHTLIVSKVHYFSFLDAPPTLGTSLVAVCHTLAEKFQTSIGATAFNLLSANGSEAQQSVMHLHMHFLPRRAGDGINAWPTFSSGSHSAE